MTQWNEEGVFFVNQVAREGSSLVAAMSKKAPKLLCGFLCCPGAKTGLECAISLEFEKRSVALR